MGVRRAFDFWDTEILLRPHRKATANTFQEITKKRRNPIVMVFLMGNVTVNIR